MRFELTTSAVTGRHSNQLNYQAKYASPALRGASTEWCQRYINSNEDFPKMIVYYMNYPMVEVTGLEPVTPCL